MAVINLKVLVDGSAIDTEISKINSSFNKGIKGTAVDNLQKKYANLISTVKNYEKSFPKDTFEKQTASLTRHLNRVKELSQSYERSGKLTKDQQKQYHQLSKDYANISAKVATLRAETEKLEKSNKQSIPSVDNLRKKYANLINTIQGSEKNYARGTFSKITEEATKNLEVLKQLDPTSADYAKTVNHLDKELNKLQADFAETKTSATNLHGSFKDVVLGFAKFQLAATAVMVPLQLLKKAISDINETLVETESRTIALSRVLNEDIPKSVISTQTFDLAQKYGQTVENVSDALSNFAKSGYSWDDAIMATEAALVAMNVAELDVEQSTEGLIAIMKQFGYGAEDLMDIVDLLNYTADNAAVTTEELLIALQKTGSTAKNAGLDLKETVALITKLSESTAASGQNIGNALRSLFVFTSDKKALETFAGLSSEMNDLVRNYRSGQANILDVWQGLGRELEAMEGNRGRLSDLLGGTDLGSDLEGQLTQIEDQFAEIYGTAGNYRQNYFIALMQNIGDVDRLVSDMNNAQDYSAKENLETMETYEKKLESVKAHWEEIANDPQGILQMKKDLLETADAFLNLFEYVGDLYNISREGAGWIFEKMIPNDTAREILSSFGKNSAVNRALNMIPGFSRLNAAAQVATMAKNTEEALKAYKAADTSEKIKENTEETSNKVIETVKTLKDFNGDTLTSIADKIKGIRDQTKDAYDFEEKKKAVLEAEQALLDAQNERTTRVYNAQTGQWEWHSNQREIQRAQDTLTDARKAVEDAALAETENLLRTGNATNGQILEILDRWETAFGSGDFNPIKGVVLDVLEESGVKIGELTNFEIIQKFIAENGLREADRARWGQALRYHGMLDTYNSLTPEEKASLQAYDSGGVLHGLGGIKATTKDEVVLDPEMASKILSPVSNAQFHSFVNDLGLLFGASASAANAGNVVYNNGQRSTDSHDSHYSVNGIPISSEVARSHTIEEIFGIFNLV